LAAGTLIFACRAHANLNEEQDYAKRHIELVWQSSAGVLKLLQRAEAYAEDEHASPTLGFLCDLIVKRSADRTVRTIVELKASRVNSIAGIGSIRGLANAHGIESSTTP